MLMYFILSFPTIQPWRLFGSVRITLVLTLLGVLPNIYKVSIFPKLTKKNFIKEIKNLEVSNAVQNAGVPKKVLMKNAELFPE